MKKLGFIAAAVVALAVAAPSVASAEKIVIKRGGEHHYGARPDKVVIKSGHRYGARAEFRGDRGYRLPEEHHSINCQQSMCAGLGAWLEFGNIGRRQDRAYTGQRARSGDVNPLDARVGVRAA